MYYRLPRDPAISNPLIERFFRENIGASQEMLGIRRRPLPVRNLMAKALVKAILLSWIGPQNLAGVTGYNVYQGSDKGSVVTVPAPQFPSTSSKGSNISLNSPIVQVTIPGLVTGTKLAFWVSCHTALLESIKMQIIATPS